MAGNNEGPKELDVLALLHEVHGSQAGARGEAVEDALRAMEITHRQASLAMRQFERSGRVGPAKAPPVTSPLPRAKAAPAPKPEHDREVTAVWRPEPAQKPGAARAKPYEAAPLGETARSTRAAPAQAASLAPAAPSEPDPATPAAPAAPQVYAGKGAEVQLREPTKTQIFARRKP